MSTLPPGFGYVIFTGIASGFMLMWKAMKVGAARKKYNVAYPTMYSADQPLFNCVQRAHQNTLENYPLFLFLLLAGGLTHPLVCSGAGLVWIAGRVAYALGYYTGEPKKRVQGAFGYLGLLTLLGCAIHSGIQMI